MKDSQLPYTEEPVSDKYIKANNERFSTNLYRYLRRF